MAYNSPRPIMNTPVDFWILFNALELLDTTDPIDFGCLVPRTYLHY